MSKRRIAIIGSGISGLTCAHYLQHDYDIQVFEAGSYIGGHVNTIDYTDAADNTFPVDTGFIVFNHKTYPHFVHLLKSLDVPYQTSDMSFSVKAPVAQLEYCGNSMNSIFGQRRNLMRPKFHKMLREILRFNKTAPNITDEDTRTIGAFLEDGKYSDWFKRYFIVPMGAAIWSSSFDDVLQMPALFFIRFFENHGMLSVYDQPTWYTISNGARSYVEAICKPLRERIHLNTPITAVTRVDNGVQISYRDVDEMYDEVIFACHADTALKILNNPCDLEQEILNQFPYSANQAILHNDKQMMPKRRRCWASWNYLIDSNDSSKPATLTYYMNLLQSLPSNEDVFVTLNTKDEIDTACIKRIIDYQHPKFGPRTLHYQQRHQEISGKDRIHFCGAYWRNGFHEDGCWSGIRVCKALGVKTP